ncbi:TonB-dependent receptor plug domain-containing protein [Flavobacterium palustre]|uniref:TonB-dependent receptor plug domain-containing protein n=1 Tax=Flavobacterium palustre TaxID=1476463 RepID=UPI003623147D
MTYSAQTVSTKELSEARSLNVANSLSGKVAGLNFSTTGSGVGSSSRITLRGNRSLTGITNLYMLLMEFLWIIV